MHIHQGITFLFLFSVFKVFAQDQDIQGVIITESKASLESASVYLIKEESQIMIKSAVTNEKGEYIIQGAPHGKYRIEASSIGYNTVQSSVFEVGGKNVKIDTLILSRKESVLEEVQVERKLPQIQMREGKTIMNVENSSLATGNNAMEILKRAPGISVDNEDEILLMGQAGVNVTIDGRETYMSGEQLADFLKSTDGDQIKSIEVSTTRSAKEEAEGGVGRVNIVLKKNKLEGFTGTFNATAGQGDKFRANTSLSVNYKVNGTTLFGSYAFQKTQNNHEIDIFRIISDGGEETQFDQSTQLASNRRPHNYRFGIEQKTSDRNILTLQFSGLTSKKKEKSQGFTHILTSQNMEKSFLDSHSDVRNPFERYTLNLNNEFKIDTASKKITADLNWSKFNDTEKINYYNQLFNSDNEQLEDAEIRRAHTNSIIEILSGKMDYQQSIGKGKLETGVKYSHVKTDNNLTYENYLTEKWQHDATHSNHFIYTEEIAAAYADYTFDFAKWGLKAGLRAEHTFSKGNSVTLAEVENREYTDLFPSVNVHYNVSDNHMLNVSYAKKISRPSYSNLNPFEYYLDKYTSVKGNPFLKPQYTDSFALTYTLMQRFNATLGYDYTHDAIVESIGQDAEEKTTWIYRENLADQHTTYININAPVQIGSFWSMNNNLTFIRLLYNGPIAGEFIKQNAFAFQGNSMHNFQLGKGFSSELNLQYMSPFLYNVYKISAKWSTDIGFTKKFKDERSSLKFSVSDIFRTDDLNLRTEFGPYNSILNQRFDSRVFRLTFSYTIGNLKQKTKSKLQDTDEQSRAM